MICNRLYVTLHTIFFFSLILNDILPNLQRKEKEEEKKAKELAKLRKDLDENQGLDVVADANSLKEDD